MKPFSNMELASFCGQLALILKSGISSLEGLTIMLEDAASPDEKEIFLKKCRKQGICINPWTP